MLEQMTSTPLLTGSQGTAPTQSLTAFVDFQKSLLFTAIEHFADGLVIVARTGDILHCNRCAQRLLQHLAQSEPSTQVLPQRLWQNCQALIHAGDLWADAVRVVLEDEIQLPTVQPALSGRIRVRVQWFNADTQDCFLILLEDCAQSAECFAQNEAYRYGLTPRETEVWQLKRADYTYREIAQQLYISENTVKKHLKNVYAKREQFSSSRCMEIATN